MSQKQYNEWRLKAEDFASEWIKNMAKKVEANPNYKPDSIDSVAEYKLYNIVKDKDNFSNLRSQIEKAFSYELAKNIVVMLFLRLSKTLITLTSKLFYKLLALYPLMVSILIRTMLIRTDIKRNMILISISSRKRLLSVI